MMSLKKISTAFTLSCVAGVIVSLYALSIEWKLEENEDYEALCDISEQISCTNVFSSRWGRGFGVVGPLLGENSTLNQPNSLAGIIFYTLLGAINQSASPASTKIQLILSLVSNVMSIYLASILYFILYDFCVVCFTTYVINAILLFLSWRKRSLVLSKLAKKK